MIGLDLGYIIAALKDLQTSKLTSACGLCLFGYDIILTSEAEYRHIWRAKWSMGKAMYLFVRYPWFLLAMLSSYANISSSVSVKFCSTFTLIEIYAGIVEIFVVQLILTLRTYAIYRKQKWILWLLVPLVVLGNGADIGLTLGYQNRMIHGPPALTPLNSGCMKNCINCERWLNWFWVPQVIIDTVIFSLTLYKALGHVKDNVHRSPIMYTLYRDGFLYFLVIFVCETIHLVMWNTAGESKLEMFVPLQRALVSSMCCRLLLNIRCALTEVEHSTGPTMALRSPSLTPVNLFELEELEMSQSRDISNNSTRRYEVWEGR